MFEDIGIWDGGCVGRAVYQERVRVAGVDGATRDSALNNPPFLVCLLQTCKFNSKLPSRALIYVVVDASLDTECQS